MPSPPRTRSSSRPSKRKRNPETTALLRGHDPIVPPEPSLTQRLTAWLTATSSPTLSVTPSIPPPGTERMKERGVRGASPAPSISDLGYLGDREDGEPARGRRNKGKKDGKDKKKEDDGEERNLLAGPTYIDHEEQLAEAREMVCATPLESTSQIRNFPDPLKRGNEKGKQVKRKKRSIWNFFSRKCVIGDQDGGLGGGFNEEILVDECDGFILVRVKPNYTPDPNGTRKTPSNQSTGTDYQMEGCHQKLSPLPIPKAKESNERSRKRPGLQICMPSPQPSKKRSFSISKKHRISTSRSLGKHHAQQSLAPNHLEGWTSLKRKHFFQIRQTNTDIQEELQQAMEASLPKLPRCFPLSAPGTPLSVHHEEMPSVGQNIQVEGSSKARNSILTPGVLQPTVFKPPPPSSLPSPQVTTEQDDYFGLNTILRNFEAQDLEATRREEVAEIEEILCALDEPPVHWDVSGFSIPIGEKYLRALESGMIDEASLISDPVGSSERYLLAPVSSPAERKGWVPEGFSETDEEESRVGSSSPIDVDEYGDNEYEKAEYGEESQSLSTRFLKEDSLQFAMEQYLAGQEPKELGGSYVRLGEDSLSTQSSPYFPPSQSRKLSVNSPANSSPLIFPNSISAKNTLIQPLLKPTQNQNSRSLTTPNLTSQRRPSPRRLPLATPCSLENSIVSTYSLGPEREWWYGTTPPSPQPVPRTWIDIPIPTSTLSPRLHIRGGGGFNPPSPSSVSSIPSTPSTDTEPETSNLEEKTPPPPPPPSSQSTLHLRGGGPPSYRKKERLSLFSLSIPAPCPERGKELLDKQVGLGFYILGGAPGRSMTYKGFNKLAKERVDKQKKIDAEKEEKRKKRCDAQDKIDEMKKEIARLEVENGIGVGNQVKGFLKSDDGKGEGKGKKAEEPVMSGGSGEGGEGEGGENEASGGEASGGGEASESAAAATPEGEGDT